MQTKKYFFYEIHLKLCINISMLTLIMNVNYCNIANS